MFSISIKKKQIDMYISFYVQIVQGQKRYQKISTFQLLM